MDRSLALHMTQPHLFFDHPTIKGGKEEEDALTVIAKRDYLWLNTTVKEKHMTCLRQRIHFATGRYDAIFTTAMALEDTLSSVSSPSDDHANRENR